MSEKKRLVIEGVLVSALQGAVGLIALFVFGGTFGAVIAIPMLFLCGFIAGIALQIHRNTPPTEEALR